ncbi:hypothetical protein AWW70_03155 [Bacillus mycoides]|uniref:N-acetylglucosamine-6-phosphate deacetylase n=1 Tax=Bacillus mycoides TaxID=1405 RepID=A0A120EBJ2_BACMY|nr:hypothetical protein [Bacillus mycoides]KWU54446.1 hypothetical protein AWW70_03155 [Bacillus mycoides]
MKMAIGIDIGGTKIMVGSILQLKEVVKNAIDWRIASPEESGMIANGYDADFIALTPELDLTVTYLDGVRRFQVENLIGKEGVR